MIKLGGFIISLFIIIMILLQLPQENVGLSSFTANLDRFGSSSSAQRFLKIITAACIFIYFGVALQLNLRG